MKADSMILMDYIKQQEQNPKPEMTEQEVRRFIDLIRRVSGIALTPEKEYLISARLGRRIRKLTCASYQEYYDYLNSTSGRGEELPHFIDLMTTNTTRFFRESKHFDYIIKHVLPIFEDEGRLARKERITCWSVGCSTGQEPYSLAMVLADYFNNEDRYAILATDISTGALETAGSATYPASDVDKHVPAHYCRRYLMYGTGVQQGKYRVIPELRDQVLFQFANLVENDWKIESPVDLIMCRNVLIYFDTETQKLIAKRLFDSLSPGGFLFIGHSETLSGMGLPFNSVAPTIYRKAA